MYLFNYKARNHDETYKIILWNMNFVMDSKSPNVGDKALLESIIKSIKDSLLNANIIVFSSDPDVVTQNFNVIAVKYHPLNFYNIVKTIRNCDLFVFAGGEVIIDRGSSLYTPFMMQAAILAKMFKKKIMGYGIGIGKSDEISFVGKLLSRFVFRESIVSVRDITSEESIKSISAPRKVYCTADPAINLKAASREEVDRALNDIGVNINERPLIAIVPRQPLMPLNKFYDRVSNIIPMKIREKLNIIPRDYHSCLSLFKKRFAEIGDYLVEKYNAKLFFIPMSNGFMSYRDDILCNDIIMQMNHKCNAKVVSNDYSAATLKGFFGKMDLVMGLPLHSIILASSMGVPVIAFSYESKVERYMEALDLEQFTFNVKDITEEININKVTKSIDYIMRNKEQVLNGLQPRIDALKQKELNNVKLLLSVLKTIDDEIYSDGIK